MVKTKVSLVQWVRRSLSQAYAIQQLSVGGSIAVQNTPSVSMVLKGKVSVSFQVKSQNLNSG